MLAAVTGVGSGMGTAAGRPVMVEFTSGIGDVASDMARVK